MSTQRLIVEVEGSSIEPLQLDLFVAERAGCGAVGAAPAAGLHLVLLLRNCPKACEDSLERLGMAPEFAAMIRRNFRE